MSKVETNKRSKAVRRIAKVLGNDDVKQFEKAAKKFAGDATVSRKRAKDVLVALGISTQSGKLTKKYR